MCKRSNTFSLAVLIGRGLDHNLLGYGSCATIFPHNIYFCFVQFSGYKPFYIYRTQRVRYFSICGEFLLRAGWFSTGFFSFVEKFFWKVGFYVCVWRVVVLPCILVPVFWPSQCFQQSCAVYVKKTCLLSHPAFVSPIICRRNENNPLLFENDVL